MQRLPVVVVDTTTIHPDLQLNRSDWRQLLDHSERGDVRLFIPEIVVRESERHFSKKMTDEEKKSVAGIRAFRALGFTEQTLPTEAAVRNQAQTEKDTYRERLLLILSARRVSLLPLPSVSHDALTRRELDGRKPFKDNGTGYRDALIWSTVLELCAAEPEAGELLFVSANHTDFCDGDGAELAQQLVAELPAGWTATRVRDVKALNEMIAAIAPVQGEHVTAEGSVEPEPRASEDQFRELLADAVAKACELFHYSPVADPTSGDKYDSGLDFSALDLPWHELDSVTLASAEPDLTTLVYTQTSTLASGDLMIDVRVEADIVLDGYTDKSTALGLDEGSGPVQVYDFDWNDHTSNVTAEVKAVLEFTAYAEPPAGSGNAIEIEFERGLPVEAPSSESTGR